MSLLVHKRASSMQCGMVWSTLRDEWDGLLALFVFSLGIFLWVLRPHDWYDLIHGESEQEEQPQELVCRGRAKNAGEAPANRPPWSDPTGGTRSAGLASSNNVQAAERRTKAPSPSLASGRARSWNDPTGGTRSAGLASGNNVQAAERRTKGAGKAPSPSLASGPAGSWSARRACATRMSSALPPGPTERATRGPEIKSPETKAKMGGQEDVVLLKAVMKSVAEGRGRGQAAPPTPLSMSQPSPRKMHKRPSSGSLFYTHVVNAQVQKCRSEREEAYRRQVAA